MTHVTCRLTAKHLDELRNPTLGNRAWATITFFTYYLLTFRLQAAHCAIYKLGLGVHVAAVRLCIN